MKSNELRIGNWVYCTDGLPVKIWFGADIDNNNKYEPIPLTSKILKENGFQKSGFTLEVNNCYTIRFERWDDRLFLGMGKGELLKEIFSVHQFQNLYFALTGEELIINL